MEKESFHFKESIHTIIGEGAEFRGEFILPGNLRIDGTFSGRILSDSKVIVGPTGHVKTNIQARQVIVAGRVDGNIYATEAVHLFAKAQVYGDIIAANLIVEEGVIFEGRAKINQFTGFPS
ncbi:MAG: polymer-forming cytoskeletal protein [Leptospiraceae bacterium]|nr:polymer-forming cytoskeletal protein [Leptospiraceae bacterium]MDW8307550.1 polymer-forming cytoskeletal protein [Leptospiraceae bacterium]